MTTEAKDYLNQLANQLHTRGHKADCGHVVFQSYVHNGKRYCFSHWIAKQTPLTDYENKLSRVAQV